MTHTPGPWRLVWWGNEKYPYPLSVLADNDGMWITRDGTASSEANARLIARAPDLLAENEALRAALEDIVIAEEKRAKDLRHREAWLPLKFSEKRMANARAALSKTEDET